MNRKYKLDEIYDYIIENRIDTDCLEKVNRIPYKLGYLKEPELIYEKDGIQIAKHECLGIRYYIKGIEERDFDLLTRKKSHSDIAYLPYYYYSDRYQPKGYHLHTYKLHKIGQMLYGFDEQMKEWMITEIQCNMVLGNKPIRMCEINESNATTEWEVYYVIENKDEKLKIRDYEINQNCITHYEKGIKEPWNKRHLFTEKALLEKAYTKWSFAPSRIEVPTPFMMDLSEMEINVSEGEYIGDDIGNR